MKECVAHYPSEGNALMLVHEDARQSVSEDHALMPLPYGACWGAAVLHAHLLPATCPLRCPRNRLRRPRPRERHRHRCASEPP